MTVLVENFKYPQIAEFKHLFIPPLTVDKFNKASKQLKRHGLLASTKDIKRFVWKLSEVQIKVMFDFFSSSQTIQDVAFGTIKAQYIHSDSRTFTSLSLHTVAIWTFTYHEKSDFV